MFKEIKTTLVASLFLFFGGLPVLAQDQGTPTADALSEYLGPPSVQEVIDATRRIVRTNLNVAHAADDFVAADEAFDQEAYATAERLVEIYTEAAGLGDDVAELLAEAQADLSGFAEAKTAFDVANTAYERARMMSAAAQASVEALVARETAWQDGVESRLAALEATVTAEAEARAILETDVEILTDLVEVLCPRLKEEPYGVVCGDFMP